MKPDSFENLLKNYGARPVPAPRSELFGEVWSAIAARRGRVGTGSWFSLGNWQEIMGERGLLLSGLAVAVALGVAPAIWAAREPRAVALRHSLHLEAFSADTLAAMELKPEGAHR